jgi:hypothetical protein
MQCTRTKANSPQRPSHDSQPDSCARSARLTCQSRPQSQPAQSTRLPVGTEKCNFNPTGKPWVLRCARFPSETRTLWCTPHRSCHLSWGKAEWMHASIACLLLCEDYVWVSLGIWKCDESKAKQSKLTHSPSPHKLTTRTSS